MSREKQIEEMANAYYEAMLKARGTIGSMNEGAPKWYAKELYAKGYRKQNEVLEEFANRLKEKLYAMPTVYNAHFRKMVDAIVIEMKGGKE